MYKQTQPLIGIAIAIVLSANTTVSWADTLNVAVATNFKSILEKLSVDFSAKTGHKVVISAASSGALFNQITNGAPFDLFLSADAKRPTELVKQNLALASSQHTYAVGQLLLVSNPNQGVHFKNIDDLKNYHGRLSIANPKTAPYGVAAQEVLTALNSKPQLVQGSSIQQTWQFVVSGNSPAGLVAKSQWVTVPFGRIMDIPTDLYSPIKQDVVILKRTEHMKAAQALVDYLMSDSVQKKIHDNSCLNYRTNTNSKETSRKGE